MKADVTTVPNGLCPPRYDEVQIGIELGPAHLIIDDHLVASYRFALDDATAGPVPGTGDVTPAILANELLLLYYYRYRQADCAAVHTRNTLRLHRPVALGMEVTVRGRHVEKFVRRGRGYVVSETAAVNAAGELVASNRAIEIMDGIEDTAGAGSGREVDHDFDPQVTVTKRARFDQVCVFSNIAKRQVNIHNDVAFAASRGFGEPVVQGMQQVGYLAELGQAVFGPGFWSGGVVETAFVRPLYADAVVQVQVASVQGSPTHRVAACRVLDSAGRPTTVGSLAFPTETATGSAPTGGPTSAERGLP